jgi:PAS domain S-box-containing protein
VARRISRKQRLDSMLNLVSSPCFVIDAERRLVFANSGCEQLTGWPASELVGRNCELTSGTDARQPESVTECFAPPQEVLGGERLQVPRYFVHRESGRSTARLIHFFPLSDDDGVLLVLGVVTAVPATRASTASSVITEVHAELAALRHELRQRYGRDSIVSRAPRMRRVFDQIEIATHSRSIVHCTGEAGTGREHVARVIHYAGEFGQRPFVPLNCRELSIEELTGALRRLVETGWDEGAGTAMLQPGAIFLSEVDHLPRDLQSKLADFLASPEGTVFRGRCRLMTSSIDSPQPLLEAERLTDGLFYLITPLQIELPALRSRLVDLRVLGQSLLEECNRGSERQVTGISEDVWRQFEAYNWPGNLAELQEVVRQAHAACDGAVISTAHLPFQFQTGMDAQQLGPAPDAALEPLQSLLARVERDHVMAALERSKGSRAKAAKLLGISRPALYRKLETFGLADDEES